MRTSLLLVGGVALVACAKEPLLDPELPAPATKRPEVQVVELKVPAGAVARPRVDAVMRQGPGWLLDQVPIEEVLKDGKFVGWRIRELPAEWSHGDLRPGDVVTRINAMPIERPREFWAAWTTLGVASELKIDYLRGDEPRVLSLAIVGQPDPALAQSLTRPPQARVPSGRDHRFDTVTIEGAPVSSEPSVDYSGN